MGADINNLTKTIIGSAYTIGSTLGHGFLEKVYERALTHELNKAGLKVRQQYPIEVSYDGVVVGDFNADIFVEDQVLVEIKTVKALDEVHMAQCLNYLKATDLKICLLLNFAKPRVEVRRVVHDFSG